MKKRYIIPTASFEPLEDENLMIETSSTLTTVHTADPPTTSTEISIFDDPVTGGQGGLIGADENEGDD